MRGMLVVGFFVAALGAFGAATAVAGQTKVTICHIPPGNPANAHTITVAEAAVPTHIAQHGDTIGPCKPPISGSE